MVVAVMDGEADMDHGRLGVALQVLAVAVADEEIHRFGEQQAAHVPQILARPGLAALAKGRSIQHSLHFGLPVLVAVGAHDMHRLSPQFQQKPGHPQAEIGVAVYGEFLAVQVGEGVSDSIHQATALLFQLIGDRLAGEPRHFHEKTVGAVHPDGAVERHHFLALLLDVG